MKSAEVREPAMSLTLPFRRGDVAEEPGQFLDVEALVRGARIEPATERLSAVWVAKVVVDAASDGEVYGV